jgi:serine/threonine protein kinase
LAPFAIVEFQFPSMPNTANAPSVWSLTDVIPHLKRTPLSISSRGNLHEYSRDGKDYVIKTLSNPTQAKRELSLLQAAADISVDVTAHITRMDGEIIGFAMPRLDTIKPQEVTLEQKVDLFYQIQNLVTHLHGKHHIIHGDINLSNILLEGTIGKLSDFGSSAWMTETVYPTEFSIRYSSPYRLGENDAHPRRLLPEEDFYASGVVIWELFVGETPLAPYISDDEEFELWDRIAAGLKVDVDRIEFEEARLYVKECLSIECLNNIAPGGERRKE